MVDNGKRKKQRLRTIIGSYLNFDFINLLWENLDTKLSTLEPLVQELLGLLELKKKQRKLHRI